MSDTTYSERGFAQYLRLTDTKGSEISVHQSSSLNDAVWITADDPTGNWDKPYPHLSPAQALQVAQALTEYAIDHLLGLEAK